MEELTNLSGALEREFAQINMFIILFRNKSEKKMSVSLD